MTAAVIDLATRRVLPKGFLVGGIAATAQYASAEGDTRHPLCAARARADLAWYLLQAAVTNVHLAASAIGIQQCELEVRLEERATDALIAAIDAVMRISAPALWMYTNKLKDLRKWRTGIPGRPTWRMDPHVKGWEAKLAADEARLRATLKPRKAKLN